MIDVSSLTPDIRAVRLRLVEPEAVTFVADHFMNLRRQLGYLATVVTGNQRYLGADRGRPAVPEIPRR